MRKFVLCVTFGPAGRGLTCSSPIIPPYLPRGRS
jgi:hypothetical protein